MTKDSLETGKNLITKINEVENQIGTLKEEFGGNLFISNGGYVEDSVEMDLSNDEKETLISVILQPKLDALYSELEKL